MILLNIIVWQNIVAPLCYCTDALFKFSVFHGPVHADDDDLLGSGCGRLVPPSNEN